jgi:hypothetical protein
MNYGDLKTLIHQRLLITFENRNFTTLIKVMHYGMSLKRPVPPWKATSNLTVLLGTISKHNQFHILITSSNVD